MNKKSLSIIPVSFITAALLAAVIFVVSGIYPGSERTLLIFDMKEQFVSFYAYMSRIGSLSNLKYTFEGSLGTPLAGLIAYYLASPLSFIYLLFDVSSLPDAIVLIDVIKAGLLAASFAYFALYKGVKEPVKILILSLCYSLSSAAVTFFILPMYLDTLFWLPLIAVSLEKLLLCDGRNKIFFRGIIYSCLLFFCILTHYYSAYMVCLFLIMYAVYIIFENGKFSKSLLVRLWRFVLYSLIGSSAAGFILMPVITELIRGKASDPGVYSTGKFIVTGPLVLIKQFICGSFGGLYSEGGPSVYCSIVVICLAVYSIYKKKSNKGSLTVSFVIIDVFICSFMFRPMYRIWHMFRDPVAYPHRFAFLFVFFLMVLAAEGIRHVDLKLKYQGLILIIVSACLVFNGYRQIDMDLKTLPSASRSDYRFFIDTTADLVAYALSDNMNLCRISKDYEFTSNDPMLLGYNGLDYFSSSYDPEMLELYKALGLLQYHYKACDEGTTILTDMLFGIDYMIHKDHADPGYEYMTSNGFATLSRNPYSLGLGYLAAGSIYPEDFGINPFDNQNLFLNGIMGSDEIYLEKLDYSEDVKNVPVVGFNPDSEEPVLADSYRREITFTAPAGKNVYLNFELLNESDLDYESKSESDTVIVSVNDRVIAVFTGYQKAYNIRLGRYETDTEVTLIIEGTDEYREAYLYAIDADMIDEIYESLNDERIYITGMNSERIEGRFTALEEGRALLLTIPYSDDIQVFVDGMPAATDRYAGALLMVPGIEDGEHKIEVSW